MTWDRECSAELLRFGRASPSSAGVYSRGIRHVRRVRLTGAWRWIRLALPAVVVGMLVMGCARNGQLDRELDQVAAAVANAEARGAMRCAPRELAIAQSRLEFARLERARGSPARANEHLAVAVENVRAATVLSTPERCLQPNEATDAPPPAPFPRPPAE